MSTGTIILKLNLVIMIKFTIMTFVFLYECSLVRLSWLMSIDVFVGAICICNLACNRLFSLDF